MISKADSTRAKVRMCATDILADAFMIAREAAEPKADNRFELLSNLSRLERHAENMRDLLDPPEDRPVVERHGLHWTVWFAAVFAWSVVIGFGYICWRVIKG